MKDTFFRVATKLHRAVFRVSRGRIRSRDMATAVLITVGRRTGRERRTLLAVPILADDHAVVVASYGGDDRQPAWYLNLCARPDTRVVIGNTTHRAVARTTSGAERAELWRRITAICPRYGDYQARTGRELPVVVLDLDPDSYPEPGSDPDEDGVVR